MSLTDTFIRNVKPASSPRKYFDGEGLFQPTLRDTGWTEEERKDIRQHGYDSMDMLRAWAG